MSDYTNPDWLCIHSVVNHQCKKCWPNLAAPLPPTAEQTSIARFNALADQIRELREQITNDEHFRLARTGHLLSFEERMKIQFDCVLLATSRMERRFEAMERIAMSELIALKRAVAKKKAAPLVGKKGTGRKG